MQILYIYRNIQMGFSIRKVFKPIEETLAINNNVSSVELPCSNYSLKSLYKNIIYVRKILTSNNFDIVHITGTEHYLVPFMSGVKIIVTVHDLGSILNIKNKVKKYIKKVLFIFTLKSAHRVTFISEKSQSEAFRIVDLKKDDCVVINNPVDPCFVYTPKVFNINCPTILHIGTKVNKNLNNTIRALKELKCSLRIVGKLSQEQEDLLRINKISYVNLFNLSDSEILNEYINCDIVNFPSFYEGFGMPIIEGQSVGRVVVTSNISPMKEIANDSAILVDPNNPESILRGYKTAISKNNLYVEKGLKNVERFQLVDIANRYLELYNSLK